MRNEYTIEGNIIIIKLNKRDGSKLYTRISVEDFEFIKGIDVKWYAGTPNGAGQVYVKGDMYMDNIRTNMQLHRIILGVEGNRSNLVVDHINRDTLDNRRQNLRFVNRRTNMGVMWINNRWQAWLDGEYLGGFESREDALEARRRMESPVE
jgi:hypothetical protein